MKSSRTGRRRRRLFVHGCLLAAACLLSSPAFADAVAAKQHYERALELLKTGALAEARTSFEQAYRESPHYLVLYNLGRVSLELGEHDAALDYLERYLEQGGDAIPVDERRRVHDMIARANAGSATIRGETEGLAPLPHPPQPPRAGDGIEQRRPPDTGSDTPVPAASPRLSPVGTRVPAETLARERQKTLAFTLGATGALMLAVGTGILIWNQNQYTEYQANRAALEHQPPTEVHSQEELERAIEYARAREQNAADLGSTRQFDVVGWTLAGAGAAAAATGVVLYLTRSSSASATIGVKRAALVVSLRY